MITSINIENFRSIASSGELEIAPITLIMGPNSSGKSSILRPLLVIKQTVDSRDLQRSVQVDGTYVDLGPFRQFVFNQNDKKIVKFAITFSPKRRLQWRTAKRVMSAGGIVRPWLEVMPDTIRAEVSLVRGAYEQTVTEQTKYTFEDPVLGHVEIEKIKGNRGTYSGMVKTGSESAKFTPLKKSKFYDVSQSPKITDYIPLSRSELGGNLPKLLNYVTRSFEIVISNIVYLGPLREEPAPLYGASNERPQDVGKAGEDAPSVLWVGRSEKKQIELRRKVEKWMAQFEIARNINLHKLGPFFQVLLTDWHSGIRSNLTDVGFGASQLLPVIVAGYYAAERSLLIVEQPEIHLHPKAQTHLGDLLIDISRENKKLLVETHSEHLIMRIQRRVADGTISGDSVALYYCEPTTRGTTVRRLHLDRYGRLERDLPKGFFDESLNESKAHLEAMMRRESKVNTSKERT